MDYIERAIPAHHIKIYFKISKLFGYHPVAVSTSDGLTCIHLHNPVSFEIKTSHIFPI